MLLHTAKNERLRPQTVRCKRRLPRPPIAGANSLDAGASAKAMLRPPRRSGHDPLAHRDHQMLMYIGAPRASCRLVEKSNNGGSVNSFVAYREWLTDIVA